MPIPATFSVATSIIAAFVALLAFGFSWAPGSRPLRWFALSATFASGFTATSATATLPLDVATLAAAMRLGLFLAGLHGATWFFYLAALDRRPLAKIEIAIVSFGTTLAILALVPGLLVRGAVQERPIPWLGAVYHDLAPTALGLLCFATYCSAICLLLYRSAQRWKAGATDAVAHGVGFLVLLAAGVNDSLAAAHVICSPDLLNVGFFAVIVGIGGTITSRFVVAARSLEEYTARLHTAQAELVKSERLAALGELSAVVAHEVRNPVGIIFNALASIKRVAPGSKESVELFAIVEEEATRLNRMVSDLLAFARPPNLELAATSMDALLTSAIEAAQLGAPDPAFVVSLEVAPGLPLLSCDERLVRQAVINLVTNAILASPAGESVRVKAGLDGAESVMIEVSDRGEGVAREVAGDIFTPFFTTRPTGTGLGLAIVRGIAEAHGGRISLAEQDGAGATFVMRLPLAGRLTS